MQRKVSFDDDDHVSLLWSLIACVVVQWFKKHQELASTWAQAACNIALILVSFSSAADERVFSFLLDDRQGRITCLRKFKNN